MSKESESKSNQPQTVSELDEKLMADKDGTVKQEILDKLKPHQEGLAEKMSKGELAPEEFEVAKAMKEALDKAEACIRDR